jgi:ribonucleoside-triphosphate reductase
MSDRKSIEARIAELRGELAKVEGRPTEVYSRIVGYYRSVRNWNAGKRSEYAERRAFAMPDGMEAMPDLGVKGAGGAETVASPAAAPPSEGVLVFTRAACPNCPPVANYVVGAGLAATFVDVDRAEGFELARRHGVMSTPTVLGLDAQGRELFRALDLGQLKDRLGTARV